MGATLAFMGIKNCMPLIHGAQGCGSFTKVFFTRHFSEPIAMQNTTIRDISAVIDGGDININKAIESIKEAANPEVIGLYSTGLTETKGDDIAGVAKQIDFPIVSVNTSDYEGDLESGWSHSVSAIIKQIVKETTKVVNKKALLIPNVSLEPIEVEKMKEFLEDLGFTSYALPDLSDVLDGHLTTGQSKLSDGGIAMSDIETLGECEVVITVGESVKECGVALLKKNHNMKHIHVDSLYGLEATDNFVAMLMDEFKLTVSPKIQRWRSRLQDALLDSHFVLGASKAVIAGERDLVFGITKALKEAGLKFEKEIVAKEEDLEDLEKIVPNVDLIITNFHGEALAKKYHKAHIVKGFPDFEEIGNRLKNNILYEGGCYLLFEASNSIARTKAH